MQTILGSGGAIGEPLAKELLKYTDKVRLVSRNPVRVNASDELFAADLKETHKVDAAVEGSEVVYLTAGLQYKLKTWIWEWPLIMQNVIEACIKHQAKLVFFDNVYMYAKEEIHDMMENSRVQPPSAKGKVREQINNLLFEAMEKRGLQALIARSADFYGPDCKTGILNLMVIDNLKKGKKAMWQADINKIHSFTYTPDAARAVAQLGNSAEAYGQVWHLPTSKEKLTGNDFIHLIAKELKVQPQYRILSRGMCSVFGLFVPILRELKEMMYQYELDYYFDSSKFEEAFGWKATSYQQGLKEVLQPVQAP